MSFINLTTRVLNKLHIVEIIKEPGKYSIHMSNNSINGFLFLSSGGLSTNNNIIEIYEKYHKEDYDILSNLIKK